MFHSRKKQRQERKTQKDAKNDTKILLSCDVKNLSKIKFFGFEETYCQEEIILCLFFNLSVYRKLSHCSGKAKKTSEDKKNFGKFEHLDELMRN